MVIQRAVRHWLVRQRQHQLHRQVARIQVSVLMQCNSSDGGVCSCGGGWTGRGVGGSHIQVGVCVWGGGGRE